MSIKALIVEDHPIVRMGLEGVVASIDDMVICAQCEKPEEAIEAVRKYSPDIAIVDLMLGKVSALPLIQRLLAVQPDLRVLILSMHDEMIYAERAIHAGAHGYVMKGAGKEALCTAIRTVLSGELYVSDKMRSYMLKGMATGDKRRSSVSLAGITATELHILQMLGSGMSVTEIANAVQRSIRTIETHRNNIRLKLGLPNSSALLRYATQWVQAEV